MTKEQFTETMHTLIINHLKEFESINGTTLSPMLIATIEECVYDAFPLYQEEKTVHIPSNLNLIWSFFENEITTIASYSCFQSEKAIKERMRFYNLIHYLSTAEFFGIE